MATIKRTVKIGDKPSEKELQEIRNAATKPIVFDEDSPELTEEQYAELAAAARAKRASQKKTVVALRVSPGTLKKAKAVGKGYTGFLSRLLDNAINDPDMVKRSM